ncbi:MAG TPA: hypothetical protein VHM23_20800 [Actinomycetota bacterium]|jgi:hypothetical protein|nr:hypothetical protein [Actinomycetota bacterium]
MDSNTCSRKHRDQPTGRPPDRLAALTTDLNALATQDRRRPPSPSEPSGSSACGGWPTAWEGHWLK